MNLLYNLIHQSPPPPSTPPLVLESTQVAFTDKIYTTVPWMGQHPPGGLLSICIIKQNGASCLCSTFVWTVEGMKGLMKDGFTRLMYDFDSYLIIPNFFY